MGFCPDLGLHALIPPQESVFREMCEGLLEESDGEGEPGCGEDPESGAAEGLSAPARLATGEKKTEQQRRREKAARALVRPGSGLGGGEGTPGQPALMVAACPVPRGCSRPRCGLPACGTRSSFGCVGSRPRWHGGWRSWHGGVSSGGYSGWQRRTSPAGWGGSSEARVGSPGRRAPLLGDTTPQSGLSQD